MDFVTCYKKGEHNAPNIVFSYYDERISTGSNRKTKIFINQALSENWPIRISFYGQNEQTIQLFKENNFDIKQKRVLRGKLGKLMTSVSLWLKGDSLVINDLVPNLSFLGPKNYWMVHDIRPAYGMKGVIQKYIYKLLLRLNYNYVAISDFTIHEIQKLGNDVKGFIKWTNGINTEKFKYADCEKKYDFIIVGNLEERKNHRLVIDSIIQLSKRTSLCFKVTIVFSGGNLEEEIREICRVNSENIKVSFDKNISDDDLIKKYQSSYVSIHPSKYEGFGLTLLEGYSTGTIIAASNIKPHKEINPPNTFWFDPNCRESIEENIGLAYNNSRKNNSVPDKYFLLKYTWENANCIFLEQLVKIKTK